MNFLFLSPNFPVRYFKWVEALKNHGVTVLGIGDSPLYDVHPRLISSLKEYRFVQDLNDYPSLLTAARSLSERYGPIDYLESDNEWWLSTDARLRKDLNIKTGLWPEDMEKIKAKHAMKEAFQKAGAKTMRYVLVDGPKDLERVLAFAQEVGYPLFAKPDIGVGASDSFKLKDEEAVRSFLKEPLKETHIIEEYIQGTIVSFDGICDKDSNVVFATSDHFETPVADVVNEKIDYLYFANPFALPFPDSDGEEFLELGKRVVKSFAISKRFFHIEFFLLTEDRPGLAKKGEFVALECNMRPPGGYTPDLIDFANSVSCYEIYADVICYNENRQNMNLEKYYAFASARKDNLSYLHSPDEIKSRYENSLCMSGRYPPHIASAMGNEFYYAKFKDYQEGVLFDRYVRAKKN